MDAKFWLTIGASALLGACATGLWSIIKDVMARRAEAKSLEKGLIAEVKTILHLMSARKYRTHLENILRDIKNSDDVHNIWVLIDGDFNPVYKANVNKIGMLNSGMTTEIVKFHACLYAITQDFNERSQLANKGFEKEDIEELISLFREVEKTGSVIVSFASK
jgi:hypothetical protein